MKWLTPIVVLLLIMNVSAVKLEYSKFFPECSFEDNEFTIESVTRCGCYFLLPNFHLAAGYDLVILSFGDGMSQLVQHELELLGDFINPFMPWTIVDDMSKSEDKVTFLTSYLSLSFLIGQVGILLEIVVSPFTLVIDVLSGILAYMLLLLFETAKTYIFWIALPLASLNLLMYALSQMSHLERPPMIIGIIFNPVVMPVIIAILLILGTIALTAMDIGIFTVFDLKEIIVGTSGLERTSGSSAFTSGGGGAGGGGGGGAG